MPKAETKMFSGSGGGGRYQGRGVGNSEAPYNNATRVGRFPGDNMGPGRSQGETPGAGSIYAAALNERPNVSNLRNLGPERGPSRSGSTAIPVATVARRNTGRL